MTWPTHGSNPNYLYQALGMELPAQYIDFSANINPLGPPEFLQEKWNHFFTNIMVYPDPEVTSLTEKLAYHLNIGKEWILFGNGASELIGLIGRLLFRKKVLIIQPAFSEYEWTCSVNQCQIINYQLMEPLWNLDVKEIKKKLEKVDAVFLCNPSNPTGVDYSHSDLLDLLDECKEKNCLLILDEAFYDYLNEYESMVPYVLENSNILLLRSMTKMFAIPGIRLGYVVANPKIIAQLKSFQPHWSVNAIAMQAGELCLENEAFQEKTRQYITRERTKIFTFLNSEGYAFSRSETNYYLMRDPGLDDQFPLFLFLLNQGVVPRHTMNFSGLEGRWMRFAIKNTAENERLMEVLKQWRSQS